MWNEWDKSRYEETNRKLRWKYTYILAITMGSRGPYVAGSIMLYLMVMQQWWACDTAIYEAESTYILSDFKNVLIYNDHCTVHRVCIVPLVNTLRTATRPRSSGFWLLVVAQIPQPPRARFVRKPMVFGVRPTVELVPTCFVSQKTCFFSLHILPLLNENSQINSFAVSKMQPTLLQ